MSPTTYRDDGTVTVHEGDAPPEPAKSPVKGRAPAAPKAPRPSSARAPKAPRAPKAAKGAVGAAETQRRRRVAGKHKV